MTDKGGFTDKDLKRLKEDIAAVKPGGKWAGGHPWSIQGDSLEALLARLEASEALLPWANCRCGSGSPCHCGYWEKKEAWRKACGK